MISKIDSEQQPKSQIGRKGIKAINYDPFFTFSTNTSLGTAKSLLKNGMILKFYLQFNFKKEKRFLLPKQMQTKLNCNLLIFFIFLFSYRT
jgi:hypothetical protein